MQRMRLRHAGPTYSVLAIEVQRAGSPITDLLPSGQAWEMTGWTLQARETSVRNRLTQTDGGRCRENKLHSVAHVLVHRHQPHRLVRYSGDAFVLHILPELEGLG